MCSGTLGDFDGDGIRDCVRTEKGTTFLNLVFYKGLGANTYQATPVVTPDIIGSSASLAYNSWAVDVNHDSREDLVVVAQANPDPLLQLSTMYVCLGQVDGTFLRSNGGGGGALPYQNVAWKGTFDFTGDGLPDILFLAWTDTLYKDYYWYVLSSTGGLDTRWSSSLAASIRGSVEIIQILDMDGDGILDILSFAVPAPFIPTVVSYISVLFGDGKGGASFGSGKVAGTDNATGATTVDANADGKIDLLVTLPSGPTIFYCDGARHFSTTPP